jgi:hypothetical protein
MGTAFRAFVRGILRQVHQGLQVAPRPGVPELGRA